MKEGKKKKERKKLEEEERVPVSWHFCDVFYFGGYDKYKYENI